MVAGIFGGLFAYAIGQWALRPGFHLYQYLYITYGSFTVGWGLMLFFVLPDLPVSAWFLDHEERLAAVARVRHNQTGMINRSFKWEQALEALLDFKTWFFFLYTFIGIVPFCTSYSRKTRNINILLIANIPNGGLNAFSTTIIKGFGFSKSGDRSR